MAEKIDTPRLTDPSVVGCIFIDGAEIDVRDDIVRITGWIDLETVKEGDKPERRIVMRAAMPKMIARVLILDVRTLMNLGRN